MYVYTSVSLQHLMGRTRPGDVVDFEFCSPARSDGMLHLVITIQLQLSFD